MALPRVFVVLYHMLWILVSDEIIYSCLSLVALFSFHVFILIQLFILSFTFKLRVRTIIVKNF
jgi:hypothetical protein